MATRFNILMHGELDEVVAILNEDQFDDVDLQAALYNLACRVRALEKAERSRRMIAESGETA